MPPEDPIVEAADTEEEDRDSSLVALVDALLCHPTLASAGTGSNHPWARACGRAGTQGGRSVSPLLLRGTEAVAGDSSASVTFCRRSSPGQTRR